MYFLIPLPEITIPQNCGFCLNYFIYVYFVRTFGMALVFGVLEIMNETCGCVESENVCFIMAMCIQMSTERVRIKLHQL